MAILLGEDAFTVTNVGTVDLYHLTDDINFLPLDFYPYIPTHEYLHNKSLHGSFVVTGQVTPTTRVILGAAQTIPSYKNDFYYRIHFESQELSFGNIFEDVTKTTQVWNAYFDNTTITEYSITAENVSVNSPVPPFILKPLQTTNFEATAALEGEAVISGDILITTDKGTFTLGITGTRVVVWPYIPNRVFTESREWFTDVLNSFASEERHAMRVRPRLRLGYTYLLHTIEDYNSMKSFVLRTSFAAVPLVSDFKLLNYSLSAGETTFTLDTTDMDIAIGSLVYFWESTSVYEIHEIANIQNNTITLTNALAFNYSTPWVAPAYKGIVEDYSISITFNDDKSITCKLDLLVLDTVNTEDISKYPLYKNSPVIDDIPILSGSINWSSSQKVNILDTIVGVTSKINLKNYKHINSQLAIKADNIKELNEKRRLFNYLKGKYNTFFLPTGIHDAIAISNIIVGGTAFSIQGSLWLSTPPKYIKITGDSIIYAEIYSVVAGTGNTSVVTLTEAVGPGLNNISKVEIMYYMRLNTDRIEFSHAEWPYTSIRPVTISVPDI